MAVPKPNSEKSSDTTRTVHIRSGKWTLEQLQKLVGGYIQVVKIFTVKGKEVDAQMIVNEDGQLYNLTPNEEATKIVAENYGTDAQRIVGDAVILYEEARLWKR